MTHSITVRIKKASVNTLWYKDHIGLEFKVFKTRHSYDLTQKEFKKMLTEFKRKNDPDPNLQCLSGLFIRLDDAEEVN